MFRGQRHRIRILFGTADVVLIALAFAVSYWLRARLNLENNFYIPRAAAAFLLVYSMVVWVATGAWWETYDRIDFADPRVILRDAFRQCLLGAMSVVLFEYIWRLDLSRLFLAIFGVCTWFLLCLFRLNAGRLLSVVRREFSQAHYVMVVGLGDAALRLGRQLEEAGLTYGVRLSGFFADSAAGQPRAEIVLENTYPVHAIEALPEMLREPRDRRNHLRHRQPPPGRPGRNHAAVRGRRRPHARCRGISAACEQPRLSGPAGDLAAADVFRDARTTRFVCWSNALPIFWWPWWPSCCCFPSCC